MKYPVNELWPMIQGEGRMAGVPMILIRLQGCNMRCPWCDTKYTWSLGASNEVGDITHAIADTSVFFQATAEHIAQVAQWAAAHIRWALITGGEPAAHDLMPLVNALYERGFKVALETNGTCEGHMDANFDWVCVSPKLSVAGPPVLSDVVVDADEIKFIITELDDIERVRNYLALLQAAFNLGEIFIQPMNNNPLLTTQCVDAVIANNWCLSRRGSTYE